MTLPYIINVSLILVACLAFYKLLLNRETFYKANRFLLIACLAIAFTLPLLQVPQQFSLRKGNGQSSIVNKQQAIDNKQSLNNNQSAGGNLQTGGVKEQPATIESIPPKTTGSGIKYQM
jgi:hypothetical protein